MVRSESNIAIAGVMLMMVVISALSEFGPNATYTNPLTSIMA